MIYVGTSLFSHPSKVDRKDQVFIPLEGQRLALDELELPGTQTLLPKATSFVDDAWVKPKGWPVFTGYVGFRECHFACPGPWVM